MKKYIVETLSVFRNVYVIESEDETQLIEIANVCDPNYDEWLGNMKFEIKECSEEDIKQYESKKYFYKGSIVVDADGEISYRNPDGSMRPEYK